MNCLDVVRVGTTSTPRLTASTALIWPVEAGSRGAVSAAAGRPAGSGKVTMNQQVTQPRLAPPLEIRIGHVDGPRCIAFYSYLHFNEGDEWNKDGMQLAEQAIRNALEALCASK